MHHADVIDTRRPGYQTEGNKQHTSLEIGHRRKSRSLCFFALLLWWAKPNVWGESWLKLSQAKTSSLRQMAY